MTRLQRPSAEQGRCDSEMAGCQYGGERHPHPPGRSYQIYWKSLKGACDTAICLTSIRFSLFFQSRSSSDSQLSPAEKPVWVEFQTPTPFRETDDATHLFKRFLGIFSRSTKDVTYSPSVTSLKYLFSAVTSMIRIFFLWGRTRLGSKGKEPDLWHKEPIG